MSVITGLHHISIKSLGYEAYVKSFNFYHQVLGMPVVRTWGEGDRSGAMLQVGDSVMELGAGGTPYDEVSAINHIAIRVTDTDAITETVMAAGFPITTEPKNIVIGSVPPFPARISFCTGPSGESIEFFQEL